MVCLVAAKKRRIKRFHRNGLITDLLTKWPTLHPGGASLLWETKESYYIIYADKGIGSMDGDNSQIEKKFSDIGKKTTGGKKTGGYLYATGKDTLDWKEVCTNSHCSHTGFYCEARLAGGQVSVGIYDEHLYFTSFDYAGENEMGLYRMKMDGSDRELIDNLPYEKGWSTGGLYHDKYYLYYMYQRNLENDTADERIYVYSLKEEGNPVLILEEKEASDLISYRMYPIEEKEIGRAHV